uniref:Uncharacterized protein n=1 Tax=Oryza glaberrima TaxID=4538 RepID=I1QAB6_ORYGL
MELVSQPGEVNAAMWAEAAPSLPVAEKVDVAADEEHVESSDAPEIMGARQRPRSDGDVALDSTTACRQQGGLLARDRQPPGDSEATAAVWNERRLEPWRRMGTGDE